MGNVIHARGNLYPRRLFGIHTGLISPFTLIALNLIYNPAIFFAVASNSMSSTSVAPSSRASSPDFLTSTDYDPELTEIDAEMKRTAEAREIESADMEEGAIAGGRRTREEFEGNGLLDGQDSGSLATVESRLQGLRSLKRPRLSAQSEQDYENFIQVRQ